MTNKKYQVAVLGSGNMGTALAQVIAGNGFKVKIWNYEGDLLPLEQVSKFRENKKYLPKIKLSRLIQAEADLCSAIQAADLVIFAVPSSCLISVVKRTVNLLGERTVCVDVSKGLIDGQISFKSFPKDIRKNLVSISGPAIAKQMALGNFTIMNVASASNTSIQKVKSVLENKQLKLIVNNDLIGLELAGSFKNVYAILLGICDGLKKSENTKAVLFVLALQEMGHLIKLSQGKIETAYDFCGLGDLLTTALSRDSRNRRFGQYLGRGLSAQQALQKVKQTVEGQIAVKEVLSLAKRLKTRTPLASMIDRIIKGQIKPSSGLQKILTNIK